MPSSGQNHLPSLAADSASSGGRNGHSASLRGHYHSKVPEIAQQPLHTLLPVFKEGTGCQHPEPYYLTQNVVLKVPDGIPPWMSSEKNQAENIIGIWQNNHQFQNRILDELIKDCLHMEVAGIVSSTLVEKKSRNQEEAHINAWLEDHVVTDSVYMATENIVWEALWDQARKLKKRQIEDLEAGFAALASDSHMLNILRENYMRPLNTENGGQSLINKKWAELLYHTNRYMQRGSLMENYAIRKLQEQIIGQIAAKVLLDESLKCLEQELTEFDEEERIDRPPRKINKQQSE